MSADAGSPTAPVPSAPPPAPRARGLDLSSRLSATSMHAGALTSGAPGARLAAVSVEAGAGRNGWRAGARRASSGHNDCRFCGRLVTSFVRERSDRPSLSPSPKRRIAASGIGAWRATNAPRNCPYIRRSPSPPRPTVPFANLRARPRSSLRLRRRRPPRGRCRTQAPRRRRARRAAACAASLLPQPPALPALRRSRKRRARC